MWKNKNTEKFKYGFAFLVSIISLLAICSYTIGYTNYLKQTDKKMKHNTYKSPEVKKADKEDKKVLFNENEEDVVDVGIASLKIMKTTKCKYMNVDLVTTRTSEKVEKAPKYFVGLTRGQLEKYYENYMQNIPTEEVEKGLQTINVINFSNEQVTIEKIYDASKVGYYVVEKAGEIKVYYNNKKTLYENTGIATKELPYSERTTLREGIYVDSKEELMAILESYSS